MKARLICFSICLVLGAMTTVAVAWGLAVGVVVAIDAVGPVAAEGVYRIDRGNVWWWCRVLERPGLTVVVWDRGRAIPATGIGGSTMDALEYRAPRGSRGPWPVEPRMETYILFSHRGYVLPESLVSMDRDAIPSWARLPSRASSPASPNEFCAWSARGWPMRALWYEATFGASPRQPRVDRGGLALPEALHPLGRGRVLPGRPILGGFVVDTGFYALIWIAMIRGPVLLRRAYRRRRGHCTSCGYDLSHGPHRICPECGRFV
ncbi:MAG: hypothetical protein ACYSXF_02655 [Planctomycetota bacterium]